MSCNEKKSLLNDGQLQINVKGDKYSNITDGANKCQYDVTNEHAGAGEIKQDNLNNTNLIP